MSTTVRFLLFLSLAATALAMSSRLERIMYSFPAQELQELSEKWQQTQVPTEDSNDEALNRVLRAVQSELYRGDPVTSPMTSAPISSTISSIEISTTQNPNDLTTEAPTKAPTAAPTHPSTDTTKDHKIIDVLKNFKYFISPGLASSDDTCRKHSEIYYAEVQKNLKAAPWALKMLDSSGNFPPSGIYYGNIQSPGNWEECLDIQAVLNKTEYPDVSPDTFGARNCRTHFWLQLKKGAGGKPSSAKKEPPKFSELEAFLLSNILGGKMFRGVCVPSSCSHEDVQLGTNLFLAPLGILATAKWEDCDVNDDNSLTNGDIAMIALLSTMGVLLILATLADLLMRDKKKRLSRKQGMEAEVTESQAKRKPGPVLVLISSFSVVSNVEKLFTIKKGELDCVHGIRFFSMTWVILAHTYTSFVSTPSFNIEGLVTSIEQFMLQIVFNGSMCVDSFFFLSGFLVAFVFFRVMRKTSIVNMSLLVVRGYVYRFMRLTPAYAWTIGIAATIFFHFGSGPYWKSIIFPMVNACQEKWWTNLIYLNNFLEIEGPMCMDQSWYLAVDMQFFLVAPLIMVPIIYHRLFGFIWAGFVLAVSIVVPAVTIYINDSPPGVLMFNVQSKSDPDFLMNWYAKPYNRFSAYLIGLICGYLFVNRPKKTLLNRKLALLGWFLATGVGIAVVFGMYRPSQFYGSYTKVLASLYGCLHKVAWSLCIAWVIFACTQGYGGPVNSFLSSSSFIPLSRMSYCSYLVALHLQKFYSGTRKIPMYFDHVQVMYCFFGHLIFTHLLALIFTVCFESPFLGVTKILMDRGGGGQRRKEENDQPKESSNDEIEKGQNEEEDHTENNKSEERRNSDELSNYHSQDSDACTESETEARSRKTEESGHHNPAYTQESETGEEVTRRSHSGV